MKAQDAIKWLSEYDPEQEIIIAWWDKETTGYELTDEQWATVIEEVDKRAWCWEAVTDAIDDSVGELENNTDEETE